MYDRFKTRRRKTGIYKAAAALAIISGVLFLGYRYQRYLTFWKYNQNKLVKKVEAVRLVEDKQNRRDALAGLADTLERYREEHEVDPDAFFMAGEVHYLLGEAYLPGSFSELFINDKLREINNNAKTEFMKAIKDIQKGSALDNAPLDENFNMMLAKSCFYTEYRPAADIYRLILKSGDPAKFKDVENIRFFCITMIINKREDYGLKLLSQYGEVRDNIKGLLFYATAERIANKFTGAIMSYKNVLAMTSDDNVRKLVHVNLGKIYFNKSLFRESIDQFTLALKIDEKDMQPKIWIGKNYSALGQKDKAKAIWSEVLTTDGANNEARELLKTM